MTDHTKNFVCGDESTPPNPERATIDFETKSLADIRSVGAWLYSLHPSTKVLCLSIRLPHYDKAVLWNPELKLSWGTIPEQNADALQELFDWIEAGGLVEAHNVFFERSIWRNVCQPRMDWPEVPEGQWRCSAAKASMYALPRALGAACEALDLDVKKDGEGRKAMLKLCKPRKPRKAEKALLKELKALDAREIVPGEKYDDILGQLFEAGYDAENDCFWYDDLEDYQTLFDYCNTDTDAEHGLSEALPDLPEHELRIWQMDQAMNLRGIEADGAMAEKALSVAERAVGKMNAELEGITGIKNVRASQRKVLKEWLADEGVDIPDTTKDTLEEWTAKTDFRKRKPGAHRVLEIIRDANKTSTRKYQAVLDTIAPDSRIRDMMMYHGAATGRWSGKGLQPHNFPRGSIKDMDTAVQVVHSADVKVIEALYGDVMGLLSGALRGVMKASEGKELMVADYSAIEARAIAWLSHQEDSLEVFRAGKCIYMDMATSIYGYLVNDKVAQFEERQMGKQAILGLGFGMGFVTFLFTCYKYNITFPEAQVRGIVKDKWQLYADYMEGYFHPERSARPEEMRAALRSGKMRRYRLEKEGYTYEECLPDLVLMKFIVDAYRKKYGEVVQMWEDLESAAIKAVQTGQPVYTKRGRCTFRVEKRFLTCELPSGRKLHYCDPKVVQRKTPWGEKKASLAYMSVNGMTRRWELTDTYGGKLAENVTQAVARDLMAEAMVAVDEDPLYSLLLSVHDEAISEVPEGEGSVKEFEDLMSQLPRWATGCPVTAEGWRGKRYRK